MAETTLPSFAPGTLDARIDDPTLAAAVAADPRARRRGALERAPPRARHDALVGRPGGPGEDRQPPRLARPARRLQRPDPGPRGLRRGDPRRRLHDGDRGRDGRQQPGPGGDRHRLRRRRGLAGDPRPRLDRPGGRRGRLGGPRPARAPCSSSATKSGTTTETLAFQADAWERIHDALAGARRALRVAGRASWSPSRTPASRSPRSPTRTTMRGVFLNPESVGGRYSALSYVGLVPGVAGRRRPRPVPGRRRRDARAAAWRPTRRQPRRRPRRDARGAGAGRPRQADLRRRPGDRPRSAPGWSSSSPRAPASSGPASCRSTASRSARPAPYGADRVFVRIALDGAEPPAAAAGRHAGRRAARRARPRPATRSSASSCPTRSTWPASSSAGRSRPRSPAIVLGVNPFDEPNVTESKENTKRVLEELRAPRQLPRTRSRSRPATGIALYGDTPLRLTAGDGTRRRRAAPPPRARAARRLPGHRRLRRPDGRARRRRSTGSGPACATRPAARRPAASGRATSTRPASSTRAAPPIGWFLQLTADHPADLPGPRASRTRSASSSTPRRAATWRRSRPTTCRSSASTSAPTSTPGWPPSTPPSRPPFVSSAQPFARADVRSSRQEERRCASASSASAGWAPTWSAASSATATRSSPSTGRRRRRARS